MFNLMQDQDRSVLQILILNHFSVLIYLFSYSSGVIVVKEKAIAGTISKVY